MPIAFRAVSRPAYEAWLVEAHKKFAQNDDAPKGIRLAAQDAKR